MRRILVLSPHPDDEAIGCGGTILRHARDGDAVHVVFLTSGERGYPNRDPVSTAGIREDEARRSAAILEIKSVAFWRQPDGELRASRDLRERVRSYVEAWEPDLIYVTHGGEKHPDHRAAARLVRRALADLRHRPSVLTYEIWSPLPDLSEVVDITPFIEQKMEAIRAHASQCQMMRFDDAAHGLSRYRGVMHCWPDGEYAEAFATMSP